MYLLFSTVINNSIMLNKFINTYFFTFFNQNNFFSITSMTIHHSNAFFQFLIFFFFINNCLKVFMTNSLFINALDILLPMPFNLLLASITILLCFFFLFLIVFKNFFTNPNVTQNVRPQLAPIIPAGAPITLANDAREIRPDNIDKTFNYLSK